MRANRAGLDGQVADLAAAQAALQATHDLFATAFLHAPIGMTLVALDGTFLKVNPAFGEIVGYTPQELEGMTFHVLTHPDDVDADTELLGQLDAGRIPSYRVEKRHIRKDGSIVWIDLSVSLIRHADGAPKHYVAQVQDLTAHRLAADNLREAASAAEQGNQAKSSFLAVMSHEIRTPLNGVLGMTQAMAADELSEIQRARLAVIRESGESLLAILNDVLDLSKIEAGRLELEQREFSLGELARGAHSAFTALANKKGLSFDLSIHPAARGVYLGDSTRVRQILYNLISNALKFTHEGHVQVQVSRLARGLRFKVRDTGVGIAHDRIGSLFQRFEQEDASTTRRFGGTGLGLAICRELVELMGGCIRAESELGEGSTFIVDLPVERIGDEPPPAALIGALAPDAAPRPDRPLKVLAAEDNSVNQLVLKTILHQIGVEPQIVSNGLEALEAWRREDWDLILMDIQMPELDGPGAVAEIRREEAETGRRRTPVVALTANAMSHQMKQYLADGMDSFVAKPIEVHKLYAVMEAMLAGQN
jgi:PAS domain S-box-containing protein